MTAANITIIRPEFDTDTREQKAEIIDRVEALSLFLPSAEPTVIIPSYAFAR